MSAHLQNERERVRRGAGRGTRLLAVVLALLAQATLPHAHLAQRSTARPSHVTCIDAATSAEHATALRDGTPAAAPEHTESRCPICQTLAHSHDVLPANSHPLAHLDREQVASAPTAPDGASFEPAPAHAPRSPPVPA